MAWNADPYWKQAAAAALDALEEADLLLVPQEFVPLCERFAPLEFSWGLDLARRVGYCCAKDDVDRIAPALRDAAGTETQHYRWANEVFVLGGNFDWQQRAAAAVRKHAPAWFDRLRRYAAGVPARAPRWRTTVPPGEPTPSGRRVLVIGASAMGNVGDDLLAEALVELLYEAGASEVRVAGPDIDPLCLGDIDALVIGGGGLLYASRNGANEWQNLANYLKFGPLAAQLGIPAALIGVGEQDHASAIVENALVHEFARRCLAHFSAVTTRDVQSSALLQSLGVADAPCGADLVFAGYAKAADAPRPTRVGPPRLALGGELFDYPEVAAFLTQPARLAEVVQGREYDLLVMSEDDRPHIERAAALLRAAGASISVVDLRGQSLATLLYQFACWHGVITTRFHALVLAALSEVPVLALDVPQGKKARLLREAQAPGDLLLSTQEPRVSAQKRLADALSGVLSPLPRQAVRQFALAGDVHRRTLARLIGPRDELKYALKCAPESAPESTPLESAPLGSTPLESAPSAAPRGAPVSAPSNAPRAPAAPPARTTSVAPAALINEAGSIGLCWAASTPETHGFANLGDSLSAVMVCALAGRPVHHVDFDAPGAKLAAVGSIAHAVKGGAALIWGAGVSIRGGVLVRNVAITRYDVRAIRGPISASHLRGLGVAVPDVFGDPVWLLPSLFHEPIEKKYELGVIPHIQDIEGSGPSAPPKQGSERYRIDPADASSVVLINTWHEPTWPGLLATLRRMLECKRILSQSFHGVVIAEAYGIPVLNFRQLPGAPTGLTEIDLTQPCTTDPRIFEFYQGGRRAHFAMYAQRRNERSDWAQIMRTIDRTWEPFDYDAAPLVEAFPFPLAYDPLRERLTAREQLQRLRF